MYEWVGLKKIITGNSVAKHWIINIYRLSRSKRFAEFNLMHKFIFLLLFDISLKKY